MYKGNFLFLLNSPSYVHNSSLRHLTPTYVCFCLYWISYLIIWIGCIKFEDWRINFANLLKRTQSLDLFVPFRLCLDQSNWWRVPKLWKLIWLYCLLSLFTISKCLKGRKNLCFYSLFVIWSIEIDHFL